MTSRKLILAPVLAGLALAGSASAATLLSTNFQGHATGSPNTEAGNNATDSSLNAVTTGGTWALNTGRGATYTIVEDASGVSLGNKALLLDDALSGTALDTFTTLSLTSATSFATNAITFTTETIARRAGTGRSLLYQFLGSGGTVGASILWTDTDAAGLGGTVSFNGGTAVSLNFLQITAWDADSTSIYDLSAVFSGNKVTMSFGGISSGEINVLGSITSFGGFRVRGTASAGTGSGTPSGLYLDEILVTQVPEPRAALLGGLGLLALLRRRR